MFTALVVDDDPNVSATICHALKQAGFETLALRQHHDVPHEIEGRRFNLAFIDVRPPDALGLDLAATLKQTGQVGDCIVMAAGAPFDTVVRAVRLGAYDFLQKPFTPADLKLIIARVRDRWDLKQRVRRAELQHAALIQNIPLLIYALNAEMELCFINKTVEEMLGFTPEEAMAVPRWMLERVHPQDRDAVTQLLARSFATGQPGSIECRLLHQRGSIIHGIIRTIPYLECDTDAGQIRRLDGIFVDLTDRIHLEQALVQSARLKTLGAISAEVAHEVRNPLMSIAGFARRLDKKTPDTPEVGIILRESKRLESLLNRIRDYLKPVPLRPVDVSLNVILADARHRVAPEIDARRVWCAMDLDEHLPPALGDPQVLEQVVVDILRNALQATPPGGEFRLRTVAVSGSVRLECRHPMHPERPVNPDMVMLPFDEGGFNDGLPTSHRLITAMQGTMQVALERNAESGQHPGGEEVVVTISLPRGGNGQGERPDPLTRAVQAAGQESTDHGNGLNGMEQDPVRYCFEPAVPVLAAGLFEDLLTRALRSGHAHGMVVSLLLLDLDRFEPCLRTRGQAWADSVQDSVAAAMDRVLARTPTAMVIRHGFHELAVILPGTGLDEAVHLAENLRKAVLALGIVCNEQTPDDVLTASLGVAASLPDLPLAYADILAEAGKALFLAKQRGRNAVCCAPPGLS